MLDTQYSGIVDPCSTPLCESHETQHSVKQNSGLQAERQRLAQIPGMANPHEALKEEQMDD